MHFFFKTIFICTNTFTINGYGKHWQYTITNDYGTELGHGSDSGMNGYELFWYTYMYNII
jgi:hypothetical protein